jgi:hypothetical protein
MQTTVRASLLVVGLLLLGMGCEAEATNDFLMGQDPIPPPPPVDAGTMPDAGGNGGPTCMPMPAADCSGGAVVDMCSSQASAETGTIKGTLTTSTTPDGPYEAKGDLYISIIPSFDSSACATEAPPPVALTIIHCADLSDGKAVPFEVHGVPPRSEAWQVSAFLDPNANSIDGCDLLALPAAVTLTSAGETGDAGKINLGIRGTLLVTSQPTCGYAECM